MEQTMPPYFVSDSHIIFYDQDHSLHAYDFSYCPYWHSAFFLSRGSASRSLCKGGPTKGGRTRAIRSSMWQSAIIFQIWQKGILPFHP